jgi:hypothetical protein
VRAAYGLGLFVTAAAFLAALRSMPVPPAGRSDRVDLPGALLLACGLFLVLLLASETSLWSRHLGLAVALAAIAVVVLSSWAACERRSASPLVDVRLLRHRAVAGANTAMLAGGVGMYLLLTLITRYAQTPPGAGYGFGLTTFVAGLVLVPFSLLGFVAGKLTPRLRERVGAPLLLAGSAIVVLGAFALFALARSDLAELLAAMAILGSGVGSFSAAMPGVILAVTAKSETSSAMSFNQVVRSVGFSLGSAVGGLVLAAGTETGQLFPADSAYTTAALAGIGVMTVTAITSIALAGAPGKTGATGEKGLSGRRFRRAAVQAGGGSGGRRGKGLVLTEQDPQRGQRAHALRLHHAGRQVKQLGDRLHAVVLPVAQDDDGAVPRGELPEGVKQRDAQLGGIGRHGPVRDHIGLHLGRALEPLVIEEGPHQHLLAVRIGIVVLDAPPRQVDLDQCGLGEILRETPVPAQPESGLAQPASRLFNESGELAVLSHCHLRQNACHYPARGRGPAPRMGQARRGQLPADALVWAFPAEAPACV